MEFHLDYIYHRLIELLYLFLQSKERQPKYLSLEISTYQILQYEQTLQ